jgi:hypothetical protein
LPRQRGKGDHHSVRDRRGLVDDARAEIPVGLEHDVAGEIELHAGTGVEIRLAREAAERAIGGGDVEIAHELDQRAGAVICQHVELAGSRGGKIELGLAAAVDLHPDKV